METLSINTAASQDIEVYWQDEVELNLDVELMYIKSGQAEIKKYVETVAKPDIEDYVKEEAVPLVTKIVHEISEPVVEDYVENTIKPEISSYADEQMAEYATRAETAETNAKASETAAKESETNAKSSETAAAASAAAALASATAAASSETASAASKTAAANSATSAAESATNASNSATAAASSATAAESSETNAKTSETNAKSSETAAKSSETNSKASETAAGTSATAAASSATAAAGSATAAAASATEAANSAASIDTSTLVTLAGSQTITGAKTFVNGIDTKANNVDVTTAPTADVHHDALEIRDVNGVRYGIISITQTSNNQVQTKLMAQRTTADGVIHYCQVHVAVDADGTPSTYTTRPKANSNNNNIATTSWVRNVQPFINVISATSGTVTLATNKVYTMSISDATTFTLPTSVDTTVFNQIKVMATVTGTPTITWGTTNFFNKETPEIEAGSYDFYFDYDNGLGAWVAGVLPKGAAS